MCGLILALNRPPEDVARGLYAMKYRGDFDKSPRVLQNDPWTVGHVRLAIQTGEDWGLQPFEDNTSTYAFVGEVFGEEDEASQIVKACTSPFLEGFHDLDGFWSVVRADQGGYAMAITDYLGVKPLYYWAEEGIVCSEIEPMFAMTLSAPEFDEVYLSNCIKFGYDYSGRTPWKGITQVAPGTVLRLSPMGWEFNSEPFSYWDWDKVDPGSEDLTSILRTSTLNRGRGILDADKVHPSLLLSGGLDSTIVYKLIKEQGIPVDLYFYENQDDAEYLPDDPNLTRLENPTGEWPDASEVLSILQAPMDLGSLYPQVLLARAIGKKGSQVVLTGDGADELFGGYRRARQYDSQHSDIFCELPYYHLPRLDRVHMAETTELRSPFINPKVVKYALGLHHSARTHKQALKAVAAELGVSDKIIHREKTPLKSSLVLDGGVHHRIALTEAFRARF